MSIDLDWLKLDASLANHVVDLLNRQLDNTERPSFIGPVQVTSLDFGSNAPDVELIDMRDIYRDFLEDDDEEDHGPVKVTEGGMNGIGMEDEEGYEWVSRRAGVRQNSSGSGGHQYLPPHLRHTGEFLANATSMDPWTSGLSRPPSFGGYGLYSFGPGTDVPFHRSPSPATPFTASPSPPRGYRTERNVELNINNSMDPPIASAMTHPITLVAGQPHESTQEPPPPPNPHPNLQLHFHVNWQSNIRISLQTSLRINYPSPMFMSLPIRLSVTGLVFNGEFAVAYEGERKRIHLCILDDLDPYGPAGSRRVSNLTTGSNSSLNSNGPPVTGASGTFKDGSITSTPPELDDSTIMGAVGLGLGSLNSLGIGNTALSTNPDSTRTNPSANVPTAISSGTKNPLGYNPVTHSRPTKPVLPIGQRLLPSIFIESEIGQADKHVLKNVTRIEKFIQDVVRKTVEEELVFPNFHTLVME